VQCARCHASRRSIGEPPKKLAIYAYEGVRHAWLVDPLAQTLEVLSLEGGRWVIAATHAGEVVVRVEPFGEIELELRALWGDADDQPGEGPAGV